MGKCIFAITDHAWQAGDVLVVVSNVFRDDEDYRFGDLLELRRPDGLVLQAISKPVFIEPPADTPCPVWYGLIGMTKEDVPIGTEAWINYVTPRESSRLHDKFERIEQSNTAPSTGS